MTTKKNTKKNTKKTKKENKADVARELAELVSKEFSLHYLGSDCTICASRADSLRRVAERYRLAEDE